MPAVTLTPVQNALDSLRRAAQDATAFAGGDALALKGLLAWGWHTVSLLTFARLLPRRDSFDPWVQDFLHAGDPKLHVDRDARWEERNQISLLAILDLLSAPGLPSLKPDFYHGWQDRTARCQELRRQVAATISGHFEAVHRDQLLLLLAAHHRLLRLPAGIALDTPAVQKAVPALWQLIELLVDRAWAEAPQFREALDRCRAAARTP